MLSAVKFRLYPSVQQVEALNRQFGCVRFVWNKALSIKSAAWKERQESVSCYTLKGMIPVWKKGEYPWLKEADSQALQESVLHLKRAFDDFFSKKHGYPQFKRKHDSRQSYAYPQRVTVKDGQVFLPKVGAVKAVTHRPIQGKIKTVTVSRESSGKYYVAVLVDDGVEPVAPIKHITRIEGIDLGIKDAITDTRGNKSGNPKFLRRSLRTFKRRQQSLSRKIEAAKKRFAAAKVNSPETGLKLRDFFGSNVAKDRKRVAIAHERVKNARNDWQHKLTRQIADENQAVCAESLNIKGMMKNRKLAKAIADVGWGSLLEKLNYKLKRRGGSLTKIDRWLPSSKTCFDCGAVNEGLKLSDREWQCACGTIHDRDKNAALNIRAAGIIKLKAEGLSVSAHGGSISRVITLPAAA